MSEPVIHATVSCYLFTRWGTAWRLCVIEHPRLGGFLVPGRHIEDGEDPATAALREVGEETGRRARLLPAPLPAGYPHPPVPAPWHVVDMPAAADSRALERHAHRDHLFVGVADRPFATTSQPEHPTHWVTREDLDRLNLPEDTRALGRHLFGCIEHSAAPTPRPGVNEPLRQELLRRQEQDQAVRLAPTAERDTGHHERWQAVDQANTQWLRQTINDYGWPGQALAGRDGAAAAWLLAQHADHDPEFQTHCLELLAAAVTAGDAEPQHGALLEDRVRVAHGQPQVFGTQLTQAAGGQGLAPFPLLDPRRVAEWRAAWGFEPLEDYISALARTTA